MSTTVTVLNKNRFTNLEGSVAPAFSSSTAYSAGDYVQYGDKIYKFTSDHAAGAWTGSDATLVVVSDELKDVKGVLEAIGLSVVDGAINITYEEV